ncbi:MAG: aminotransferase class V-fold PLP-dependent enzyme [Microcystis panniformis WG22]|nr:aminotransferase class V-fold PLP-dependent enzyme [Microcystis panniformis WG22]
MSFNNHPSIREILPDFFKGLIVSDSPTGLPLDAFNPQLFRKNAEVVISKLEQYLADSSIRGIELTNPYELLNQTKDLMTSLTNQFGLGEQEKLEAIIDLYLKTGIAVYSPGYMGRQFSGVIPLAGIMDLVSSIVNQPSSFYEAAQLPNVVEEIMADELNQFIGWTPGQFAMVTTSGGSLGSLTALLAARNHKFPQLWSKGVAALEGQGRPAIAVGDAHYSITRAVGILGIGEEQIVRLPLNEKNQICLEKVRPTLEAAAQKGLNVFAMVASTGTTTMGAFDPIDQLADIAREKNIWLHVDGCHGASLLVCDQLRYKLKGIEKVDSFVWDAHKTMFVPGVCTLLFYKNKEKSYGAFHQDASYVFEKEPDIYTIFDRAQQNFECTKRPLIMNLWVTWSIYGRKLFADKLEYLCQLTQDAYKILQAEEDFETIHDPEANILCFRYLPSNLNEGIIPDFQVAIRNRIKEEGSFFISKVDINGKSYLRVVFMNHKIEIVHFRLLLREIRKIGQEILNKISKN